ncbi:MAG: ribosome silencing factor [Prolixibacteraceae bacterium]|jgi:ribosome-associated protein|nr:ribosome silencing factor [Prolixibacteraceae bacterium]
MENKNISGTTNQLIKSIIEGIQRLKGEVILDLDLTKLENTECNHFIICHGNSNTQVESIAKSVEDTVKEITGEKAWHTDGYRNAEWILLDYSDIMVHIFQKDIRGHYDLENLWADANIITYNEEN